MFLTSRADKKTCQTVSMMLIYDKITVYSLKRESDRKQQNNWKKAEKLHVVKWDELLIELLSR